LKQVSSTPGQKPRSQGEENVYISVAATWKSGVFHLLPIFHRSHNNIFGIRVFFYINFLKLCFCGGEMDINNRFI